MDLLLPSFGSEYAMVLEVCLERGRIAGEGQSRGWNGDRGFGAEMLLAWEQSGCPGNWHHSAAIRFLE